MHETWNEQQVGTGKKAITDRQTCFRKFVRHRTRPSSVQTLQDKQKQTMVAGKCDEVSIKSNKNCYGEV